MPPSPRRSKTEPVQNIVGAFAFELQNNPFTGLNTYSGDFQDGYKMRDHMIPNIITAH